MSQTLTQCGSQIWEFTHSDIPFAASPRQICVSMAGGACILLPSLLFLLAYRTQRTVAVTYAKLANCSSECSSDLHVCASCEDFVDACPEGWSPNGPPTLELDPATCYQTGCTSGGCPEGEIEDPGHSPGVICFNPSLNECQTGFCRKETCCRSRPKYTCCQQLPCTALWAGA